MKIENIEIFAAKLPLAIHFKHALNVDKFVRSIFVKVLLEDKTKGFGECIPRQYVSGETTITEFEDLKNNAPFFKGKSYENYKELTKDLKEIKPFGVGQCALELALLDAGGIFFKKTIPELLEKPVKKKEIIYSDGIPIDNDTKINEFARLIKKFQFNHIKIKVGKGDDIGRIERVRKIFGPKIALSVDANTAWTVKEAIDKINKIRKYNIEMVEQPVKTINEMKKVSDNVDIPIMADESLTTIESAEELVRKKACKIFNIRISKHGGLFNSLRVYNIAKKNNIKCLLGCHVGETDILSAAGRHFASIIPDLMYVAGSGEKFLFKDNLIEEDLTFGIGGKAGLIPGYGLGVHPNEKLLSKYYFKKAII
jgi:L-Ala-D/L-Glu epimerase